MRDKLHLLIHNLKELFGKEEDIKSKDKAVERLRLILISDRSNISPQIMENLKRDLIQTISKYMEIDETTLEMFLERGEKEVALTASIPIKRIKRQRGIRKRQE